MTTASKNPPPPVVPPGVVLARLVRDLAIRRLITAAPPGPDRPRFGR